MLGVAISRQMQGGVEDSLFDCGWCADIYSPLKEDETVDDTVVNIMYPFEDEAKPPVFGQISYIHVVNGRP